MDQFSDVKEYIDRRYGNTKRYRKVTIMMKPSGDGSLVGEPIDEIATVSNTRRDIAHLEEAQAILNEEDHRGPKQLGWQIETQPNRMVALQPWEGPTANIIEMDNRVEQSDGPSDEGSFATDDLPWDMWIITGLLVMAFGFLVLLVAMYFLISDSY